VEGDLQLVFGRNLRRYREAQGLSQEAFAVVLGVHRTYMGGVERGERNLTLRSVERLAARIGVEPLSLLLPGGSRQLATISAAVRPAAAGMAASTGDTSSETSRSCR
jgi:transcriptional regulator with XRE-family HTH domain